MFLIDCPRHQQRVLLGPRAVEALENTDHGVVVHWRCRCGEAGTELLGRRAVSRTVHPGRTRPAA